MTLSNEQIKTAEDAAEEQAAFSSVFTPDVEPAIEKADESAEETPPTDELPPAEEVKTLSLDDLKAMIDDTTEKSKAQISKLGGKLGELQQRIDAARSTVSGISPKAKERLTDEFPELAAMLFDDEPEPTPIPAATPQPARSATPSQEEVEEAQEILKFDHPDWETVVASPEFNAWTATLPPKIAKRLTETYDPTFVSGKLTAYKAYQEAQKANNQTTDQKKAAADLKVQQDKERLESGVAPRGIPRTATNRGSADDEETAAFKQNFKPRR